MYGPWTWLWGRLDMLTGMLALTVFHDLSDQGRPCSDVRRTYWRELAAHSGHLVSDVSEAFVYYY